MIHNYLARWLLRAMPAFLEDKAGVTTENFDFGEDMLERMLNSANWWQPGTDLAALRNFFLNWSDRGTPGVYPLASVNGESVDPTIKNEHMSTRLFHEDHISVSPTEKAYVLKTGLLQFDQLSAFEGAVRVIKAQSQQVRKWRYLKTELVEPVAGFLEEMVNQGESMRELMFGFGTAHRAMSLHTLTGSVRTGLLQNRYTWKAVDPVAFAAIPFKVDPTSLMNLTFDSVFYSKSLSIHSILTDVGDALFITRKYMASPVFKQSEIISQAMKYVPSHPIREFILTELLERKKVVPYKSFIPRNFLSAKLAACEAFYQSIPTQLLGFVPSFVYSNGYANLVPMKKDQKYRLLQVALPVQAARELTVQELESLVLKMQLKAVMDAAKGPIRFNIPVGIRPSGPVLTPTVPFTFSDKTQVKVNEIAVGYRDADEEVRYPTDEFTWLMPSEYVVEKTPWEDVDVSFPLDHMIFDFTVWSELDIGVELQYMHVNPASM